MEEVRANDMDTSSLWSHIAAARQEYAEAGARLDHVRSTVNTMRAQVTALQSQASAWYGTQVDGMDAFLHAHGDGDAGGGVPSSGSRLGQHDPAATTSPVSAVAAAQQVGAFTAHHWAPSTAQLNASVTRMLRARSMAHRLSHKIRQQRGFRADLSEAWVGVQQQWAQIWTMQAMQGHHEAMVQAWKVRVKGNADGGNEVVSKGQDEGEEGEGESRCASCGGTVTPAANTSVKGKVGSAFTSMDLAPSGSPSAHEPRETIAELRAQVHQLRRQLRSL